MITGIIKTSIATAIVALSAALPASAGHADLGTEAAARMIVGTAEAEPGYSPQALKALGERWAAMSAYYESQRTVPGDTPIPFWPHETGALGGTSETFAEVRGDGSYFDRALGRREAGAGSAAEAGGFDWNLLEIIAGSSVLLVGLVGGAFVATQRRGRVAHS